MNAYDEHNMLFQRTAERLSQMRGDATMSKKESDELAAFNAKSVPEGFDKQRIARERGPIVRFHGREVATVSFGKGKPRWIEIVLWETPGGAWVVERIEASDRQGEKDFVDALVVRDADPIVVMDWLGWTIPARELGKSMGWKFEEFVE